MYTRYNNSTSVVLVLLLPHKHTYSLTLSLLLLESSQLELTEQSLVTLVDLNRRELEVRVVGLDKRWDV